MKEQLKQRNDGELKKKIYKPKGKFMPKKSSTEKFLYTDEMLGLLSLPCAMLHIHNPSFLLFLSF